MIISDQSMCQKGLSKIRSHILFLVMVTKMYSDGHYLPQISILFHYIAFMDSNYHPEVIKKS